MKKTNTATELTQFVGLTGSWTIPKIGLTIPVKVLDARKAYGRFELLVTPVTPGGTNRKANGEAWVRNVKLDKGAK